MMLTTVFLRGFFLALFSYMGAAALTTAWAAKTPAKWPAQTQYVLRCVPDAAAFHRVDPQVLAAIAWVESRFDPSARAVNTNGTMDTGAFQINSIHTPVLQKNGIKKEDLHDPCVAAYVAAWLYAQHIRRLGRTWEAVGAYHSQTPHRQRWYANRVANVLMQWGVIPKGNLPFPN